MAYTITTTCDKRGPWGEDFTDTLSRQTVDTLAEVIRILNATGVAWTLNGPNGEYGVVGPFPDGTTIEVRKED